MTDNEIIKALECCNVCSSPEYCGECPYVECTTVKGCVGEMLTDALDLINRQKAEVERLTDKETPKKARVDNNDWFCCPNCNRTFSLINHLGERNRYCGDCGQRIDWNYHTTKKGGDDNA